MLHPLLILLFCDTSRLQVNLLCVGVGLCIFVFCVCITVTHIIYWLMFDIMNTIIMVIGVDLKASSRVISHLPSIVNENISSAPSLLCKYPLDQLQPQPAPQTMNMHQKEINR